MIENTFLQLLSEGEKASVSAICKRCEINRASFYLHFDDILQLERSIDRRLMCELLDMVFDHPDGEYIWSREFFMSFLNHVKNNRLFYRTFYQNYFEIICEGNYAKLYGLSDRSIRAEAAPEPPSHVHHRAAEVSKEYLIGFYEAGITMTVLQWIHRDCKEAVEEMCDFIMDMLDKE